MVMRTAPMKRISVGNLAIQGWFDDAPEAIEIANEHNELRAKVNRDLSQIDFSRVDFATVDIKQCDKLVAQLFKDRIENFQLAAKLLSELPARQKRLESIRREVYQERLRQLEAVTDRVREAVHSVNPQPADEAEEEALEFTVNQNREVREAKKALDEVSRPMSFPTRSRDAATAEDCESYVRQLVTRYVNSRF